jgi:hypothetical protein
MVHLGARRHWTRQGGRTVGRMRIDRTRRALEGTSTGGWTADSEAQKTVADHVKVKGGALRDRKTHLNLRLG